MSTPDMENDVVDRAFKVAEPLCRHPQTGVAVDARWPYRSCQAIARHSVEKPCTVPRLFRRLVGIDKFSSAIWEIQRAQFFPIA